GSALGTFRCGDSPLDHLALDPGGHNLLTSNELGEVCLESVDHPGTPIQGPIRGTGIFEPQRPAQPLIISGSGAWRWSARTGKVTTQVFATTDMFTWSADPMGRFILGNTPDGQVTGHPLDDAPTLNFGISGRGMGAVEVSRDGARVAAVDLQEIVLLRSDSPQRRALLSLPSADRQNLVFSDDANWLASATRWGDVHVWDLATINDRYHVTDDDAVIHEIAVSPGGQNITTLANANVVWWSATGTEPTNRLSIDEPFIPAVSDDGMLAVVGDGNGNLVLGDHKGQQWPLVGHRDGVWSFDFSDDRHLLITGSGDTTARVWNLDTHQQIHALSGHTVPVGHVALNRQNSMAATVGFDGSMRTWELAANPPTARELYPANPQGVFKASFSPDGRWLVALTHSSTPELFDLKNGSQTSLPREGVLTNICWDPQSQWFVLAARDGKVRRWDPQRNLEIAEYAHPDAVVLLACAPDGASLTTGAGGVVRYWPLAETGAVNRLDVGPKLASIVYTPKSNNILYGTEEGVLSRWDPHKPARIAPSELITKLRAATTACLTAHQREWILREPRELAHQRFNACERGFNREK
ncbi:MAG: WD40 repeat domain-containing protein, partial [Nannocystaceae bacterium]